MNNDWGTLISCPACGNTLGIHFRVPEYVPSDHYSAWHGRGDAIYIPMYCEFGHSWNFRLGFHKGEVYANNESLVNMHQVDDYIERLETYEN
jgi:hypothetical protein